MPIIPVAVPNLLEVYDDLVSGAESLTGAAARIAPEAVRTVLCQTGGLLGLLGGPLGPFQSPGTLGRGASDLGGILEAGCPLPPPVPSIPPPLLPPPYTGGQCACDDYRVAYNLVRASPPLTSTGFYLRKGPISGLVNGGVVPENPGRKSWGFYYGAAQCGGRFFELLASAPLSSEGGDFTVTITAVTRPDGTPDTCGDPPSPGPRPAPPIDQPPDSPEIPTVGPDGNPGSPIVFRPRVGPIYFGPGGEITVPVTINIGGPTFNTPISIPVAVSLPDFKPTFVNSGGGDNPPGSPPGPPITRCCAPAPQIESPNPPQGPDDPDKPEPEGARVVAVTVRSTQVGAGRATTYYAAKPEIHVPRIATLQFRMRVGTVLSWSLPIEIKSKIQFVEAPAVGVVVSTSIEWEGGWTGTFQPLIATR